MTLVGRCDDHVEARKALMMRKNVFSKILGTANRPTLAPAGILETVCLPAGSEQPGGSRLNFEEPPLETAR